MWLHGCLMRVPMQDYADLHRLVPEGRASSATFHRTVSCRAGTAKVIYLGPDVYGNPSNLLAEREPSALDCHNTVIGSWFVEVAPTKSGQDVRFFRNAVEGKRDELRTDFAFRMSC